MATRAPLANHLYTSWDDPPSRELKRSLMSANFTSTIDCPGMVFYLNQFQPKISGQNSLPILHRTEYTPEN